MHVEAPLLAQLLADTQAELLRKAEAAAMWQARAEVLSVQLQQAQERVLALEAPREPDALQRDSDGSAVESAQQPTERTRPWWRFW